jgi:hypothetical protein
MAYVGNPIDTQNTFQSLVGKRFNGDGSTTAFTLDVAPSSTLDIEVFVGNVRQDPNSAYTLSGTTLTFTGAPPSGTNNIYVVHQAKSVGTITPGANSVGVTELNLSDGSSGQFIKTDGSGTLSFASVTTPAVTALNNATTSELVTVGSTTTELDAESALTYDGTTFLLTQASPKFKILPTTNGNDGVIEICGRSSDGSPTENRTQIKGEAEGSTANTRMSFHVENSSGVNEVARINSTGEFLVGKTTADAGVFGGEIRNTGVGVFSRDGGTPLVTNRGSDDGVCVDFKQANSSEGSISVSGSTVSYNAFAGSHWSRLADNSKPTILRGTVMESIATMCDWYKVRFTMNGIERTNEIALPDGKSVGDTIKYTFKDVEYDGVIEKQDNERLPMCKISDTEDSKAVYGVFMAWDNEPDDEINDMYVTSLGAFVVRIHKDETVAIGDYLQSKGDGTAKKQADDILRASTIAKVTSTEKTITHSDGSYCVPCTLHCG